MSLKSIVEKMPGYNSLVKPLHWGRAVMAGKKNGWPAKKMRVIAVTGTNGKTTTSFMIWKMLNTAGRKAGVLSTVGWATGADDLHAQMEHMTTERVEVLNERMRKIADAGAEFLVLEVTSHALSQSRTYGVPIEVAVLTNVTPEHLDYHRTFENYRKAKGRLFKGAKKSVINADDESAEWFEKNASGEIVTYGIEKGDIRATDVELRADGVEYACGDIGGSFSSAISSLETASAPSLGIKPRSVRSSSLPRTSSKITSPRVLHIRTQIPGKFNVYNSLAAVAVGKCVGLSDREIEGGIYALEAVEGRMTRVREGQDFEVIVDYAHQPDALEKVFASVGHGTGFSGKIIAVHGGAGRRDHATREPRGEILGRESDIVIITEDDTRDENPQEIAQMFVDGAVKAGKTLEKDLFVELDREKAIEKAIGMAVKGDLVLILGKGHEKTILRGDKAVPFEDIKVAKKALRR